MRRSQRQILFYRCLISFKLVLLVSFLSSSTALAQYLSIFSVDQDQLDLVPGEYVFMPVVLHRVFP